MIVYAIVLCLAHAQPNVGRACSMVTDHPLDPRQGRQFTSAAACKHDLSYFKKHTPAGYEFLCVWRRVDVWGQVT